MKHQKEIDDLTMTDEMWDELENGLSPDEYAVVLDGYRERYEKMPTCGADHGLCFHYDGHKCHYKDNCSRKIFV